MKTPTDKATYVRKVRATMEAEGLSLRKACARHGGSPASFLRWSAELDAAGGDPWAAFEAKKPTGRPPDLTVDDEDLVVLRWHRLSKGSLDLAVHFASIDPRLPDSIRAQLREIEERACENGKRPNFSPSVRRAFHVTEEEVAMFHGRKAFHEVEMTTPRGMLIAMSYAVSIAKRKFPGVPVGTLTAEQLRLTYFELRNRIAGREGRGNSKKRNMKQRPPKGGAA